MERSPNGDDASSPLLSPKQRSSSPVNNNNNNPLSAVRRVRRRNRAINSCLECRRRKQKCDKGMPCTNCIKCVRDCVYLATADAASQRKFRDIKDKMGSLEESMGKSIPRRMSFDQVNLDNQNNAGYEDESDESDYDDEESLAPTALVSLDQVFEADDLDDNDVMDLGIQLGKMRVSERIGGYIKPKMVQEVKFHRRSSLQDSQVKFTVSLTRLNQLSAIKAINNVQNGSRPVRLLNDQATFTLGPGPDYIAPASSFIFQSGGPRMNLHELLADRHICDKLLQQYWAAVHPVVTIVHRPSFEQLYESFWQHVHIAIEPPASLQAVIFAAMFAATVSLSATQTMSGFGSERWALMARMKSRTETSLSKANFLRTTKLVTMQAFVMYLIPLCRAEISRAHSALTGTAIRLAECMGLHRDGTHYGFSALETHVRRLIWYHICFLDIRTCEATGPRPQIHKDGYDTRLPLNVNESDFLGNKSPVESLPYFTDLTLTRLKFELMELHRQLWVDMPLIDRRQLTLGASLAKIQKLRRDIDVRYLPLLTGSDPRKLLALHFLRILGNRLIMMLLHRYFIGAKNPMPDRLRKILVEAALVSTEYTIWFDTLPELSIWAWYRGALLQYHAALLLLVDMNINTNPEVADRVWKALDYVFELPSELKPEEKSGIVLSTLLDRVALYQSRRRVRASTISDETFEKIRDTLAEQSGDSSGLGTGNLSVAIRMKLASGRKLADSGTHEMAPDQFAYPPLARNDSMTRPIAEAMINAGPSKNMFNQMPNLPMDPTKMVASPEIDLNDYDWDMFFRENQVDFGTSLTHFDTINYGRPPTRS